MTGHPCYNHSVSPLYLISIGYFLAVHIFWWAGLGKNFQPLLIFNQLVIITMYANTVYHLAVG